MTPDDFRQEVELKIVEVLRKHLESGQMTEDRAQEISERVLAVLQPGMSLEELYRAIPKLDDSAPELSGLILPILRGYEENINQKAMQTVRELIKEGKYDAATTLATRAIDQKITLVWQGTGKPG
ncbi:MAG: hypothetical protein Q7S76_00320 [bacterium]|nr:hypothetical protein [bacterium]